MADIDTILGLVAEGKLSPEEADKVLAALDLTGATSAAPAAKTTHLRIEVTDGDRHVVNLRVPLNIAGWASSFLPGLSDQDSDRIRGAAESGSRGTILDITDNDGSRVLITSE